MQSNKMEHTVPVPIATQLSVPLHWVHLVSDLVLGRFRVGVVSTLPVKGVPLLLGNNIAGGNVTPVLEVVDNPEIKTADDKLVQAFSHVFPACVNEGTISQAGRCGGIV